MKTVYLTPKGVTKEEVTMEIGVDCSSIKVGNVLISKDSDFRLVNNKFKMEAYRNSKDHDEIVKVFLEVVECSSLPKGYPCTDLIGDGVQEFVELAIDGSSTKYLSTIASFEHSDRLVTKCVITLDEIAIED
jgi:hypothetical protein